MDSILAFIKDHIFTIILIPLIWDITNWLSFKLSRGTTSRFSVWSQSRKAARQAVIEALAQNPTYLSLSFHRLIILEAYHILTLLIILFLNASPFTEFSAVENIKTTYAAPFLALVILNIYIGIISIQQASVVFDAYKVYRTKNNLPKF